MTALHTAPTEALPALLRQALRALLDAAFDGDFSDHDWHHAVGGTRVWVTTADGVVSHGALVERRLVCAGTPLRVGYVEAVATSTSARRRGHGARVMRRIGELIVERYPLGVLSTGTHAFYETQGWERWRGATFVDGSDGRTATPADGDDIMVFRTPRSPDSGLVRPIVCDWRHGDVW
jgi:aminoglycoside 2'-N-acetyltransferase I